jgi:hypothetical protein
MKFNSQICTTREQSERLLALGLKKETADCTLAVGDDGKFIPVATRAFPRHHPKAYPAWSLGRLLEIAFDQNGPDSVIHLYRHSNPYEDVIAFLDYQIERGFIKPEYLPEA